MERPTQIVRQACITTHHLSQKALIGILSTTVDPVGYRLQDGIGLAGVVLTEKKHFLETLDLNDWEIVSFNPQNREVCININTPSGERKVALTLPMY